MNFIKTFLVSLLIYLGLNLVFAFIIVYTNPLLAAQPDAGLLIIAMMFGPITISPVNAWVHFPLPLGYPYNSGIIGIIETISLGGDYLAVIIMFLYFVIPPLMSVIIGGVIADSTTIAFGSWFLIAIISTAAFAIIIGFTGTSPSIFSMFTNHIIWLNGPTDLYIALVLTGLINAFLYGCISFLVTRKKL